MKEASSDADAPRQGTGDIHGLAANLVD